MKRLIPISFCLFLSFSLEATETCIGIADNSITVTSETRDCGKFFIVNLGNKKLTLNASGNYYKGYGDGLLYYNGPVTNEEGEEIYGYTFMESLNEKLSEPIIQLGDSAQYEVKPETVEKGLGGGPDVMVENVAESTLILHTGDEEPIRLNCKYSDD